MTAILLCRPWHTDPNAICCVAGHLLKFYTAGYRADLRDMVGHSFLQCQTCAPPTFFLGVFMRDPSPLVLCYQISKDSYEEWTKRADRTPPTGELLHRLRDPQGNSLYPTWRPAR